MKVGDQVQVSLGEQRSIFIIRQIDSGKILISSPSDSNALSLLFLDETGNYKVYKAEEVPYVITFLSQSPNLFVLDPEISLQILSQLDDTSLLKICSVNKYFFQICRQEDLWKLKLSQKFGFDIWKDKSENQTYQELYFELSEILLRKYPPDIERTDQRIIRNYPINPPEIAAIHGKLEFLKWLITSGYDFDKPTGFWLALKNGHLNILKWLANQTPINPSYVNVATENGYLDIVQWLVLDQKLIPDRRVIEKAYQKGHQDVVKWLIDQRIYSTTSQGRGRKPKIQIPQ